MIVDQVADVKPDRLILEAIKPLPSVELSLTSLRASRLGTPRVRLQLVASPEVIDKKLHFHADFTPDCIGALL